MELINTFKKERLNYFSLFLIITSILFFSILYNNLGKSHFHLHENSKFEYFDAFYFSVVTQTLLGPGDISPQSRLSKLYIIIQVTITIIAMLIYIHF